MFNELERRQKHFCSLVSGVSCQSPIIISNNNFPSHYFYGLINELAFMPLPEQSH